MTVNLNSHPVFRVDLTDGARSALTLPEVFAALAADRIASFVALRPHQAPAWHAFLVQLAIMGLEVLERTSPPGDDATAWAEVIRALTPNWPGDEPWLLVSEPDKPAFMQPPVPGGDMSAFRNVIETPDALDMLVTSKNHDLKGRRMAHAGPDDWIFALVSLQTQEGIMGAGKYGVARMNGGYGSRPYLAVRPLKDSPGTDFNHDLRTLLNASNAHRDIAEALGFSQESAIGLVWLEPWKGEKDKSLSLSRLHPLFIEVCRRIRLELCNGNLIARDAGSKSARIAAKELCGNLADPWAPVEIGDTPKVLSITNEGFSYRRMCELLFGSEKRHYRLPIMADTKARDRQSAMRLVAQGLARGQGKTEGFHSRVIPLPPKALSLLDAGSENLGKRAQERVRRAGDVSGALKNALATLFQKGPKPKKTDLDKYGGVIAQEKALNKKSDSYRSTPERWLKHFDATVDQHFFPDLWSAIEFVSDDDASRDWHKTLARLARETFDAAAEAAPRSDERRIIAEARARNLLEGALYKYLPLLGEHKQAEDADAR